ncbi:MAG: AI-2E family transporter [Bacteroidetes bacterium]|nr:AI-2E family transporter [Bacteroidota bacterium]
MNPTNSLYSDKQRKNINLGIIFLLGIFLLIAAKPIFTALLASVLFYTLFKPFFIYLTTKKHWGKSLSATIVLATSFLIVVLPLLGLSWLLINKLLVFQTHPEALTGALTKLQETLGAKFEIKDAVKNGLNDISKWAIGALSVFVSGAVHIFITLLVLYFTLFFMFRSHEELEKTLFKYLPFKHQQSLKLAKELKNTTYSNIIGQGLIGVSQGFVVAVGFLIFGIPDPLFWGIVSVFVCFLPIVGAPIIFVPAGIYELASGNTVAGVGILIWGAVLVTLIDNVLRQYISRKIANTHSLITIIGVIIGVPMFGLIGIVIGPLLISYFIIFVKMFVTSNSNVEEAAIR